VFSMTDPYGGILDFLDLSHYFFKYSSSVVLTRLSEPCSRPTASQGSLVAPGIETGPLDLWPGTLTTNVTKSSIRLR
jgi:hypothetical protein